MNTLIGSIKDIKELVDSQCQKTSDNGGQKEKEILSTKERLQKLERLKKESYLDYKEDLLTKKEYMELREDYSRQEQLLKAKLEKLDSTDSSDPKKLLDSPWLQNLLTRQKLGTLDRDTIVELVEKIEISEKNDKNQQEITVYYRFSGELKDLFQMVYTDFEV